MDRLNRGPLNGLRNFGIADSLRKIDASHLLAFHRHDANLGLRDSGGFSAQFQHQVPLSEILRIAVF